MLNGADLPKHKMALIFKWYFVHSTRLAMRGSEEQRVDYQVPTGPALGAFNQWVKGTDLASWRNRHRDDGSRGTRHSLRLHGAASG